MPALETRAKTNLEEFLIGSQCFRGFEVHSAVPEELVELRVPDFLACRQEWLHQCCKNVQEEVGPDPGSESTNRTRNTEKHKDDPAQHDDNPEQRIDQELPDFTDEPDRDGEQESAEEGPGRFQKYHNYEDAEEYERVFGDVCTEP